MRRRFTERGASAVEYGLLLAGIAAMIAIAVYGFGNVVNQKLSDDCDNISTQMHHALGSSGQSCP